MTDDRFFRRNGPFSINELALCAGASVPDGASSQLMVRDVAALDAAEAGDISVFCDHRQSGLFETSRASVVITNARLSELPHNGCALLVVRDPRLAFALVGHKFYPRDAPEAGTGTNTQVDRTAILGAGCRIDFGAMIGPGAEIGARCHIGANAVIGAGVSIGEDTTIGANTTVSHALIGRGVQIGSNVSIGGEGFGFVPAATGLVPVRQLGRVIIEDHVRIGGNCAVDRGTFGDTTIGAGTAIDNLVQIAHNVRIGRSCVIAGQAGVAGSTTIGDFVMIGGQAAISDHLMIGAHARIAGKSGVMRNVARGEAVAGCPAIPARQWHRRTVALARLAARKPAGDETT